MWDNYIKRYKNHNLYFNNNTKKGKESKKISINSFKQLQYNNVKNYNNYNKHRLHFNNKMKKLITSFKKLPLHFNKLNNIFNNYNNNLRLQVEINKEMTYTELVYS